jgi:hypothetical protein
MLRKLFGHARNNVVAYVALFIALGGTTAYAANTIGTGDIIDNQVTSADVRDDNLGFGGLAAQDLGPGSVGSSEVKNGSLTATDVTSSVLGGLGRMGLRGTGDPGPGGFCDPDSTTFVNCDMVVTLNLPAPARVFVDGSVLALPETAAADSPGFGTCRLGTTSGPIPGTTVDMAVQGVPAYASKYVPLSGVTGVLPAGQHSFGVDCAERPPGSPGGIQYSEAMVTAVALSDR